MSNAERDEKQVLADEIREALRARFAREKQLESFAHEYNQQAEGFAEVLDEFHKGEATLEDLKKTVSEQMETVPDEFLTLIDDLRIDDGLVFRETAFLLVGGTMEELKELRKAAQQESDT